MVAGKIFRKGWFKTSLKRRNRNWKCRFCLNIKELHKKDGDKVLRQSWLNKNLNYGFVPAVKKNYGSWEKFLEKGGFVINFSSERQNWMNQDLVSYFKKLHEKEGNNALRLDWLSKNKHSGFLKAVNKKYDN